MIRVCSREEVEEYLRRNPESDVPIISINDVGYDSPVPKSHPNVLRLWFDDITPFLVKHDLIHPYYLKEAQKRSLVFFDDAMAKQVCSFVEENMSFFYCPEKDIIIHCYAGVSRSVAIAFAVHAMAYEVFGDITGVDFDDCRMNSFVYGKLYKEIFINEI